MCILEIIGQKNYFSFPTFSPKFLENCLKIMRNIFQGIFKSFPGNVTAVGRKMFGHGMTGLLQQLQRLVTQQAVIFKLYT